MVYPKSSHGISACWWILKIVFFVVASFVFSVIFWATKKWFDKAPANKKKKKK